MTSFISGVALLAIPVQIYQFGASFFWNLPLSFLLATPLIVIVIIPILYRVPSFNMYHYIEMRFQSKLLRAYAVILFTFSTLIYMAVVLYTPAAALAPAMGFADWKIL